MRKILLKHLNDILKVIGLVVFFALIRGFQRKLFYDPFLDYFEDDYLTKPFPDYDGLRLYGHLIFRYVLNTIVSLVILMVLFKNKSFIKLSILLYSLSLVVLLVAFYLMLRYTTYESYQYLFYVRRFLIQPVIVILLIPAFYYQKKFV